MRIEATALNDEEEMDNTYSCAVMRTVGRPTLTNEETSLLTTQSWQGDHSTREGSTSFILQFTIYILSSIFKSS